MGLLIWIKSQESRSDRVHFQTIGPYASRRVCYTDLYGDILHCLQSRAGGAIHLTEMTGPVLCEKCTFADNRFFETMFTTTEGFDTYFNQETLAPAAVFVGWKPWKNVCTTNFVDDCMAGHILYLQFAQTHPEMLSCSDCFFDSSMVNARLLRFCYCAACCHEYI